jgi:hypothetical protein
LKESNVTSVFFRLLAMHPLTKYTLAARLAVLGPTSHVRADAEKSRLMAAANYVLRRYTRLVDALADDEYFENQVPRMRRCRPALVTCDKPKFGFCRAPFCPWCHARDVQRFFTQLVEQLKANFDAPHDPKVDVWVVPLTKTETEIASRTSARLVGLLYNRHARVSKSTMCRLTKKFKAFGGFSSVSANVVDINGTFCYRFQARGIVLVPAGTKMPPGLRKHTWVRSFACAEAGKFPTQHDLATALGICCRYSAGLLKHPVEVVRPLLLARKGLRLREVSGVLYGWANARRVRREQKPALQLFENS